MRFLRFLLIAAVVFWVDRLVGRDSFTRWLGQQGWGPVLCADGSLVHDFQGQPSCPACGFGGLQLKNRTSE